MLKLIYSPKAVIDIDLIYDYTESRWSGKQADDYILAIRDCCQSLSVSLIKGRRLDGIKSGYLAYACGSHFIIYKHDTASVTIVRVLHQRMNIAAHL